MIRAIAALAIGAALLAIGAAVPASARTLVAQTGTQPSASDDPYTVSNVEVDISANSAVEARDRAFAQAQRVALGQLMERLAGAGRVDTSGMSAAEVGRLVQSIRVNQERTPPGRYLASLTVSFKPAEVRALLSSRGVAAAEPGLTPIGPGQPPAIGTPLEPVGPGIGSVPAVPAGPSLRPVLVLPVLRTAQGAMLWDSPNPWHTAWLNYSGTGRLMPLIVPLGDLDDVSDISADRALGGDRAALGAIARRYGAGDVVVAVAEARGSGLGVTLNRYGAEGGNNTSTVEVPSSAPDRLFTDAVNRTADQIGSAPPPTTALEPIGPASPVAPAPGLTGSGHITVLVPLLAPAEWFQTQALLRNVPNIVATRLISLSNREAILQLDYSGGEDELRAALARQGLALERGATAMELRRAAIR